MELLLLVAAQQWHATTATTKQYQDLTTKGKDALKLGWQLLRRGSFVLFLQPTSCTSMRGASLGSLATK